MLDVRRQHDDSRGGVGVETLVEDHVLPKQLKHLFCLLAHSYSSVEIGQTVLSLEDGEESLDVDLPMMDLVDVQHQLFYLPLQSVFDHCSQQLRAFAALILD